MEYYEYTRVDYWKTGICGSAASSVDENTCKAKYGYRYILKNAKILVTITDNNNKVFDGTSWVPLAFSFFVEIPLVDDNNCSGCACDNLKGGYVEEYPAVVPDINSLQGLGCSLPSAPRTFSCSDAPQDAPKITRIEIVPQGGGSSLVTLTAVSPSDKAVKLTIEPLPDVLSYVSGEASWDGVLTPEGKTITSVVSAKKSGSETLKGMTYVIFGQLMDSDGKVLDSKPSDPVTLT